MGVCRLDPTHLYRRIDILCIPFEQWGAALLYFTGNDVVGGGLDELIQFNRSLRLYARKKGYSLNQRGLYKGVIRGKDGLKLTEGEYVVDVTEAGTIIASRTEQDIFDVLGIRWR
jgi:DNA polymerase lambda